jgi:hypothetical protein
MNIEIIIRDVTSAPHDINDPYKVNVYEKVNIKIEDANCTDIRLILDSLTHNKII